MLGATDAPLLGDAPGNGCDDHHHGEDQNGGETDNQGVVQFKDEIFVLLDTSRGKTLRRNGVQVLVRVWTCLGKSYHSDDSELVSARGIVENVSSTILKGEGKERNGSVILSLLFEHLNFKFQELSIVEQSIGVHHTVSLINWIVTWVIDGEKEGVSCRYAVYWVAYSSVLDSVGCILNTFIVIDKTNIFITLLQSSSPSESKD